MDMGSLRDYATLSTVNGSLTGNFRSSLLRNRHISLVQTPCFQPSDEVRREAGRLPGQLVRQILGQQRSVGQAFAAEAGE